ncbi:MAG: glucodextranase DOMON-like domain-containing protein, partial [Ignavibacteriales bacterium]
SDSLLPNSSGVIDTLCKFLSSHPEKYEANYLIGVLCARNNFRYDAFYYLNNFIKQSPPNRYSLNAENILDTLHINTNDLKYADFVREYMDAVKNGKTGLDKYWDEADKEKYGNNFDLWLSGTYERAFRKTTFTPVINITHYKEYTSVKAGIFSYAIVDKNSDLFLSHPITILTNKWFTKESRHFIFHSENPDDFPDSMLTLKLDSFFEELAMRFSLKDAKKIDYYLANWNDMGRFYFDESVPGRAQPEMNQVSSILWNNYHEVAHVITMNKVNFNSPLLGEGIAVYYAGTSYISNLLAFSWTRDLMLSGKEPKISAVYLYKDFFGSKAYNLNDIYLAAGAFNKYLLENYGFERYSELCNKTSSDKMFPSALKEVYGKDIYKIEYEFKKWLLSQKLPEITPEFNENADEIFNMEDPAGDDNGSGQYTYPTDPYCKDGIFDLRKFRVIKDSNKYYFELKLNKLVERDSLDWGFYRTHATIYIKKDKRDRERAAAWEGHIDLEGKPEEIILVSDKGIELIDCNTSNRLMMKLHKTGNSKFGDKNTNTIRFSVSKELLGNIDKDCAFFVGIGCSEQNPAYAKSIYYGTGDFAAMSDTANNNSGGCGVKSNLTPDFYDVLVPEGISQQQLFKIIPDEKKTNALFPYVNN